PSHSAHSPVHNISPTNRENHPPEARATAPGRVQGEREPRRRRVFTQESLTSEAVTSCCPRTSDPPNAVTRILFSRTLAAVIEYGSCWRGKRHTGLGSGAISVSFSRTHWKGAQPL